MENALNLFRAAAVSPRVHIGNVAKNCQEIKKEYDSQAQQTDLIVMPELSVTGYTCADLFNNRNLLDMACRGLYDLTLPEFFAGDTPISSRMSSRETTGIPAPCCAIQLSFPASGSPDSIMTSNSDSSHNCA